jgi:GNAT superfamily N-acetyltransferase
MGLTEHEPKRFAELGVVLDEQHSCTFAPSVADGLQNQGLASLLMPAILRYVQQRGKRYVVLMGGVQQTNERAVHFYRKHGFKDFAVFEHPDGVWNCDMMLDIDGYR